MPTVRPLTSDDRPWVRTTLEHDWGTTTVARLGEVIDAAHLPGFVAEQRGDRVGLATYASRSDGIEVVTIQARHEGIGVGRSLMDRLLDHAVEVRADRLWLVTTNDNIRAVAFHQRWGMDLAQLVRDGVAASRRVKPSIAPVGHHGIMRRHELVFERVLGR